MNAKEKHGLTPRIHTTMFNKNPRFSKSPLKLGADAISLCADEKPKTMGSLQKTFPQSSKIFFHSLDTPKRVWYSKVATGSEGLETGGSEKDLFPREEV